MPHIRPIRQPLLIRFLGDKAKQLTAGGKAEADGLFFRDGFLPFPLPPDFLRNIDSKILTFPLCRFVQVLCGSPRDSP
jgi:hypothetical protein